MTKSQNKWRKKTLENISIAKNLYNISNSGVVFCVKKSQYKSQYPSFNDTKIMISTVLYR